MEKVLSELLVTQLRILAKLARHRIPRQVVNNVVELVKRTVRPGQYITGHQYRMIRYMVKRIIFLIKKTPKKCCKNIPKLVWNVIRISGKSRPPKSVVSRARKLFPKVKEDVTTLYSIISQIKFTQSPKTSVGLSTGQRLRRVLSRIRQKLSKRYEIYILQYIVDLVRYGEPLPLQSDELQKVNKNQELRDFLLIKMLPVELIDALEIKHYNIEEWLEEYWLDMRVWLAKYGYVLQRWMEKKNMKVPKSFKTFVELCRGKSKGKLNY